MTKIFKKINIIFSSKIIWLSLLLTYLIFSILDFIIGKYLYDLMIIKTDYLFFWYPTRYLYIYPGYLKGPQPIFRFIYFVLLLIFLYFSNNKKTTTKHITLKAISFIILYLIISSPTRNNITFSKVFIGYIPFSPIENFMVNTERNFKTGIITTPFGKFKMHKKDDSYNDKLYRFEIQCNESLLKNNGNKCIDYPFKRN